MSTPVELLAQSLTALRNAKRFSGSNNSYRKDNPGEYAKVIAYLDGGTRPTGTLTEMGSHAVLEEDARRALDVAPPPPPPPTNAYFVSDWNTVNAGKIGYEPWATIFQVGTPSTIDVGYYGGQPVACTPNGRVCVVPNPYGTGGVLKCDIRNSDPSTGTNNFQKSELGSVENVTWDGAFSMGMEIWIAMEMYLPDAFGLASGGSNGFTNLADLHPNSNSGVPALGLGGYSTTHIQLYYGIPGTVKRMNLIELTPANRNRKIDLLIGAKVANSGGWVEAWLDGANTLPRTAAITAEASEQGPYWKQGLYKETASSFPNGGSTIYFGSTLLSKTKT